MIRAVIFDCWNTLFHENRTPTSFETFAKRIGYSFPNDQSFLKLFERAFMLNPCLNVGESVRGLLSQLRCPTTPELISELTNVLLGIGQNVVAYPESLQVIKETKAAGYKVALLSNAFSPEFEILDEKYSVREYFDAVVLSYETGLIKPDPKMFRLAVDRLQILPEEAMMVGDSVADDVRAAEACGISALLVDRNGRYPEFARRVSNLKDLSKYLT